MTDKQAAHVYDKERSHFNPATGQNVDRCKCGFTVRWHINDPKPMDTLVTHIQGKR